jgi:hypothetical protein
LLLWTAHTPCGVNSLRKSNQIKSTMEQERLTGSKCTDARSVAR